MSAIRRELLPFGVTAAVILVCVFAAEEQPLTVVAMLVIMFVPVLLLNARRTVLVLLPLSAVIPPTVRVAAPGLPDVTPIRFLMLAAIAAVLLMPRTDRRRMPGGVRSALYLYIAAAAFAYIYAPHHSGGLARLISFTFEIAVPLVLTFSMVKSREDVRLLGNALIWVVSISSLLGIVEEVGHFHLLHGALADSVTTQQSYFFTAPDRSGQLRTQGIFPHPIVQAAMVAAVLPLTISLGLTARRKGRYVLAGALQMGALIATFSRGPWIAAVVALACFFLMLRTKEKVPFVAMVMVALLVVPATPISSTVSSVAGSITGTSGADDLGGYTIQYRQQLLHAVTSYVQAHPTGAGLNAEADLSLPGYVGHNSINLATSVDNAYAKTLLELGWPGAIAFGLLLLALLSASLGAWWRLREDPLRPVAAAVVAGQVAVLFVGTTAATWTWAQLGLFYWILAGMGLGMRVVAMRLERSAGSSSWSATRNTSHVGAPLGRPAIPRR